MTQKRLRLNLLSFNFFFFRMTLFQKFFTSKAGKRALWTVLNSGMALIVAFLTYLGTTNEFVAIGVLPIAQAVSQALTRHFNQ